MAQRRPDDLPIVELFELVAVHRVREEVGEVGEERHVVEEPVGLHARDRARAGAPPLAPHRVTARGAGVGRVDEAEAGDVTALHRALRDLIGRAPITVVELAAQPEAAAVAPARVAQQPAEPPELVRPLPRPVFRSDVEGAQEVAAAHPRRPARDRAHHSELARRDPQEGLDEAVEEREVRRSGCAEVTLLGVVRALAVVDALDELGDHEVEVGVALTVTVARHVHRDTLHREAEVGPVIEVEPTDEVLVGLPAAAVLCRHHARYGLEKIAGALDGSHRQVSLSGDALRR